MRWNDLLEWNGARIDDAATDFQRTQKKAQESAEELQRALSRIASQGESIDQMRRSLTEKIKGARRLAEALARLVSATSQAGAGVDAVHTKVHSAQRLAAEYNLIIEADGTVRTPIPTLANVDIHAPNARLDAVSSAVSSALTLAQEVDRTYAQNLRQAAIELVPEAGTKLNPGILAGLFGVGGLMGGLFAAGGGAQPTYTPPGERESFDEIRKKYQAEDDETVKWPTGFRRVLTFGTQKEITKKEAALLDEMSIGQLENFKGIYDDAFDRADTMYPPRVLPTGDLDQNDNHNDAFRHAYWSARLAQQYGPEWAEQFTTAHEGLPDNPANKETMDLYNNKIGIKIAREHPDASAREMAQLIKKAVDDGNMIVIDQQGQLAWSDQAPVVVDDQASGPFGSNRSGDSSYRRISYKNFY